MKQFLLTQQKKKQYILFAGDSTVIFISVFLSYCIRVYLNRSDPTWELIISKLNLSQSIVVAIHLFTLYLLDQYNLSEITNLSKSVFIIIVCVITASLLIGFSLFFLPKYVFGRQIMIIHIFVTSLCLVTWRLLITKILFRNVKEKILTIVGNGQIISSFIEELEKIDNNGFKVENICVYKEGLSSPSIIKKYIKQHQNLKEMLTQSNFDILAYDATGTFLTDEEIRRILQLKYGGKAICDLPTLYKNLTGKVPLTFIDGKWLLHFGGFQGQTSILYKRIKRIVDLLLSILLLAIILPLAVIIAIAIKIESKGDVFFVQERLGLNEIPFRCYKFRTMIENAEKESGPVWSKKNDPRITRVGHLLRVWRLDELPQLWNVLIGDMSFVGPRPIREHFARMLEVKIPFYRLRFDVKPGLSGWAQVNHDYAGSEEGQLEKYQYELFYIQNISFFLDLVTIFKTMKVMIKGKGK